MALWQDGGYFDGGGGRRSWGFSNNGEGDTRRRVQNSSLFTLSLFHEHHLGVVLEVVSVDVHPLAPVGGTRLQAALVHQRQLLGGSLGCGREGGVRRASWFSTHPLPMQT